ncbi:MAG: hypothetical protein K6G49_03365 [Candidatus Saccharibacteria bacterium]|nr:hypothetical protein [Candidatus Saccharibacteria bacterium]
MIKSLNHNNSGLPDVTLSYLAMICTTKLLNTKSARKGGFLLMCYNKSDY